MTLQLLISKLSEAAEGSERLDNELYWELGEWTNLGGWWRKHKVTGEEERYSHSVTPAYTTSLDAALSLVKQKLPRGLDYWSVDKFCRAVVGDGDRVQYVANARTPALALCLALLKAIEAQEDR